MKQTFPIMGFIRDLVAIGERQLKKETEAAELIMQTLDAYGISYTKQLFWTRIPQYRDASFRVDGKAIPAIPTCFVGGTIESKEYIVSSLISSQPLIHQENINFNPNARTISRSNHYFAPAFAISKTDVPKVIKAQKVKGTVEVTPMRHRSMNILVGNIENPRYVVFCHYDSLGPGAIDNASGTGVLMSLIIDHSDTLQDTVYVIAGNEELSYDDPLYWGHGYRVFEQKYKRVLDRAESIISVDCVGHGKPELSQDPAIIRLAFPIKNLKKWEKKNYTVFADLDILSEVYHSDADTLSLLKKKYLQQCVELLLKKIQ
jgi:hypothetical protein